MSRAKKLLFQSAVMFAISWSSTTLLHAQTKAVVLFDPIPNDPSCTTVTGSIALTLDKAVEMALTQQPNIRAAQLSLSSTQAAHDVVSKANANPLIRLFLPSTKVRHQQADHGLALQSANIEQAKLETVNAVQRTYVGVLFARDQLKLATEAVETLAATYKVAKQLVDSGDSKNVTKEDLDKLTLAKMLAESKVNEAKVGMARAKAGLREAVGIEPNTDIEVDGEPLNQFYEAASRYSNANKVRLSCKMAKDSALAHRPELAQASAAEQISCLEVHAQILSHFAIYERTFAATSDIHTKVLPAGIINGDYRPGALAPEMPVFLAGNKCERAKRAEILHNRFGTLTEKVRNLIALEVEVGCTALNNEAEEVVKRQEALKLASQLYQKAEKSYREDLVKTDVLIITYRTQAEAKSLLNESWYKFGHTLAFLQRATGGKLWECFEKP